MSQEKKIEKFRFRKFTPIDRESPIFEILFDEEIIMDISKDEDTEDFYIMFYNNISNKFISIDMLEKIIHEGKALLENEVDTN